MRKTSNMQRVIKNVMEGFCTPKRGRGDAEHAPTVEPSPVLTSLPDVIMNRIRETLTFEDLANILSAFPDVESRALALVSTKSLVTAHMKQTKGCCQSLKEYSYYLQNLHGNHFPSARRWCRIFKAEQAGYHEERQACELCGQKKSTVYNVSTGLFRCNGGCGSTTILPGGLFRNEVKQLTWSKDQNKESSKFWMVSLPKHAIKRKCKDEFTGEAIGPLFSIEEIDHLSMKQLSRSYPSILEQRDRVGLLWHFLELYGVSMEQWTPTTALIVAEMHVLAKFADEENKVKDEEIFLKKEKQSC